MDILTFITENQLFFTILTGTLVIVIAQLIIEFIVNPHLEFLRIKQRIGMVLMMYRNVYSNPVKYDEETSRNDRYNEASYELRHIASELAGYVGIINRIHIFKIKKLNGVCQSLIGLSNSIYYYNNKEYNTVKDNIKLEKEIIKALKIKLS